MPKLRNAETGVVVSVSDATAARLGAQWVAVVVAPEPVPPPASTSDDEPAPRPRARRAKPKGG